METLAEAFDKELAGELGLGRADLIGITSLGSYEYRDPPDVPVFHNVELRCGFRARLVPGVLERIRFADGEVAALAVFSISELEELVRRQPERVASGLAHSLPIYLRSSQMG